MKDLDLSVIIFQVFTILAIIVITWFIVKYIKKLKK